jgi:hypothetical protein
MKRKTLKKLEGDVSMRKILLSILVLMITASVFAEEKYFKYNVKGTAHTVTANAVTKDEVNSFNQIRVRPKFTAGNEWLKAVLQFEIDQIFGKGSADDKYADLGADQKGVVEIKSAYIEAKVQDVKGLTLLGGIAGYNFPLVVDTDVPQFKVSYDFGMGNVNLLYIKASEYAGGYSGDDSEIYGLDFKIKTDMISVRPGVFLYAVGKDANAVGEYHDSMGILPALSVSFKKDKLGVDFSAAYLTGKDKTTTPDETEYSGYALDLMVSYDMKPVKFGVFGTMLSGDDDGTADNKVNTYSSPAIKSSDMGVGRMFILEDSGSLAPESDVTGGDVRENSDYGYWLAGGMVDASFGKFSALLQLGYAQLAKAPSGAKKDLGFEVDVNLGYKIAPSSNVFAEFAYLATGKGYETIGITDTQSAMYIAGGIEFKL